MSASWSELARSIPGTPIGTVPNRGAFASPDFEGYRDLPQKSQKTIVSVWMGQQNSCILYSSETNELFYIEHLNEGEPLPGEDKPRGYTLRRIPLTGVRHHFSDPILQQTVVPPPPQSKPNVESSTAMTRHTSPNLPTLFFSVAACFISASVALWALSIHSHEAIIKTAEHAQKVGVQATTLTDKIANDIKTHIQGIRAEIDTINKSKKTDHDTLNDLKLDVSVFTERITLLESKLSAINNGSSSPTTTPDSETSTQTSSPPINNLQRNPE